MWYLRIVPGIRHGFPFRWHEWIMGAWALVWGAYMILDGADNFDSPNGAWEGLRLVFHADGIFGAIMVALGLARFAALAINGTFHDTIYSRYSPVVRGVTSTLCALGWIAVFLSVASVNGQEVVTYPFPIIIELMTSWFVARESGSVLRAYHGRRDRSR